MSISTKKSKREQKNADAEEDNGKGGIDDFPKEEQAIARHLRLSCPNKQGSLMGMKVTFFIGNRLVDSLMDSKWGPGLNKEKDESKKPYFANRSACVTFMHKMLNKEMFHRVTKVYKVDPVVQQPTITSSKQQKDQSSREDTPSSTLRKRNNKTTDDDDENNTNSNNSPSPRKTKSSPEAEQQQQQQQQPKTPKRKFKLEMHDIQSFDDSNEPFVWIYDPTTTMAYIIGSLVILGSIGICLFPLWPVMLRDVVYYLSLVGLGLVGGIMGLAVVKYVVYGIVYACTLGSCVFWLFPNLTEDVGFFDSFVPIYQFGNQAPGKSSSKSKKSSNTTTTTTTTPESTEETDPLIEIDDATKTTETETTNSNETTVAPPVMSGSALLKESTFELSKSTVEISKMTDGSVMARSVMPSKQQSSGSSEDIVQDQEEFEILDNEEIETDETEKAGANDDPHE